MLIYQYCPQVGVTVFLDQCFKILVEQEFFKKNFAAGVASLRKYPQWRARV